MINKSYIKSIIKFIIFLIIITGFTSCNFQSENLLSAPSLKREYNEAFLKIKNFIPSNSKLTAPINEPNKNAFYLLDYNNDSIKDIVYFYKTNDYYLPLRMGIIKNNSFINAMSLGFSGSELDKFYYYDFDKDGVYEFLIQKTAADNSHKDLIIIKEYGGSLRVIYSETIDDFLLVDLNGDGIYEVVEFDKKYAKAKAIKFNKDDNFEEIASIKLDKNVKKFNNVSFGKASQNTNAIFVDEQIGEELATTELLMFKDGRLNNIFLNPNTLSSEKTLKAFYVKSKDIDSDGIIEIAIPEILNNSNNEAVWINKWYKWDGNKGLKFICSTFENGDYYFVFPRKFEDKIYIEIEGDKVSFYINKKEKKIFSIIKVNKGSNKKDEGYKLFEKLNNEFYIEYYDSSINKADVLNNIYKNGD